MILIILLVTYVTIFLLLCAEDVEYGIKPKYKENLFWLYHFVKRLMN